MSRTPLITVHLCEMTLREMVEYVEGLRARAPVGIDFELSDDVIWMVTA